MVKLPVLDSLKSMKPGAPLPLTVDEVVARLQPAHPLHILYPAKLTHNAREFRHNFPGTVMYAVKSNPDKHVIRHLARAGIKTFDAASIDEVRLVRKLIPSARIHFMHTVKSRESIREAYFQHGVKVFVLDTQAELHKILKETDLAPDLELYIRLALPKNKDAVIDFSAKFGASLYEAAPLLREMRLVCTRLGVMFHPGSQSKDPQVFARGIKLAAQVIKESGVHVDCLDVGGGFPVPYPGMDVPPLAEYFKVIKNAIAAHHLQHMHLYCEPGRALVAEASVLIARVELRKGEALYLNDGVYGGLIETTPGQGKFRYPVRVIMTHDPQRAESPLMPFRFCGPTCDSYDMMPGPFHLPGQVDEGDWVEIQMTGAYGVACRTHFNGFGSYKTLLLDPPLA